MEGPGSKNSRHVYGEAVDLRTGGSKQRFIAISQANAVAVEPDGARVRVHWFSAPSSSEDFYAVERLVSGAFVDVGNVRKLNRDISQVYEFYETPGAGTHQYRVKSVNEMTGSSPYSATISVTI